MTRNKTEIRKLYKKIFLSFLTSEIWPINLFLHVITTNKITLYLHKDLSKLLRPSCHFFFKAWPCKLFLLAPLIKNIKGKSNNQQEQLVLKILSWQLTETPLAPQQKKARTPNWLKLALFSCILFFPHFLINWPIFSGHLYSTETREGSQRGYLWYFYNNKSNSFHCSLKWLNFLKTVNFSTNHTTPVWSMSIINNEYGGLQITFSTL